MSIRLIRRRSNTLAESWTLTWFRLTVWEVQLLNGVLRTLDAEERASGRLLSLLEERVVPVQLPVGDFSSMSHVKHQTGQRTLEDAGTREAEPERNAAHIIKRERGPV